MAFSMPQLVQVTHAATPVKIGLLAPKTGSLGSLGLSFENGAKLAVSDLNKKQSTYTFSLVTQDTKTTPTGAKDAIAALATAGVSGIVGAAASSSTLSALPVAVANKIPMISYASTSPSLTTAADSGYLWRVVPSDTYQGQADASLAKHFNLHNVAVIGLNDAYGQGLINAFTTAFKAQNSTNNITTTQAYDQATQKDFSSQVTNIKNSKPDGIFMVSFVTDGSAILNELKKQGVYVPIMGTDGIGTSSMFKNPGVNDSMNGVVGSAPGVTGTPTFNAEYKKAYNVDPTIFVAEAYDAATIIGDAVIKAQSTVGADVNAQIKTVGTNFQGASGTITFDTNGDVSKASYDIWQVQTTGGKASLVTIGSWKSDTLTLNSTKLATTAPIFVGKAPSPFNFLFFLVGFGVLVVLYKKRKLLNL